MRLPIPKSNISPPKDKVTIPKKLAKKGEALLYWDIRTCLTHAELASSPNTKKPRPQNMENVSSIQFLVMCTGIRWAATETIFGVKWNGCVTNRTTRLWIMMPYCSSKCENMNVSHRIFAGWQSLGNLQGSWWGPMTTSTSTCPLSKK